MISVGSVIGGRFRIDKIVGAGGMGVVVQATHLELGHRVAIKLLRDEMAESPAIVERFLREARAVVSLRTEHVCRVIDVGRLDTGAPYIVMEMLEGVDLQRSVAQAPLPLTTAVEYVLQACVALAEAHAAGIIHRDLKPANLFVTRRFDGGPLVKVLDFGIAKALTESGAHLTHQSAMGSPGYMSPEQIQSARDVDVRTDIWALGVTLYQLLSARLPFPGSNPTEIAIKVANDPPAPLELDPTLRAVVWKCLEKLPDRRYHSVGELMLALQPFGGPNARTFVGQASQLGGPAGGFSPVRSPATAPMTGEVIVSATRATRATQATQATGGSSVLAPLTLPPPPLAPPRRRRWWLTIGMLLVVGVGGAVAGMIYVRQPTLNVAPPAPSPTPAPPATPAPGDAPGDATMIRTDASDPWGETDHAAETDEDANVPGDAATPADAAPRSPKPKRDEATDIDQAMRIQRMMMACQGSMTSQLAILTCVCKQPGAKDMPELKSMCAK